jgi:ribose transport system substrate-binding protein
MTNTARRPLLLAALLLFAGCGVPDHADPRPGSASGGKPRPRIALVMKSLANEFFATMEQGARKHAEAHPGQYELIVNGIKDERDLARQTAIVDELIAQKVDAIVLAPADSKALVAACQRARRAGIAVVNIDNKLDDEVLAEAGLTIPFVGPDNRAGARLAADHLAKQLKSGDPVAVLEGIPTAFNGQQRKLGFDDAIAAAGLKLVSSQSGQWESAIANQVAAAVLTEHPEIRALLCANDNMALGALAAARAANRAGDLLIIGYDGIGAVREAIREGGILATVEQHADQLAVFGIEYALKLLDGETPADQQTPVELVTRENAG